VSVVGAGWGLAGGCERPWLRVLGTSAGVCGVA
jgi:hypothetical protein